MTKGLTRGARPSAGQLLKVLLDAPDLAAEIPRLPPLALAKVLDAVGLEDAGEIVALATTEQLVHVFDEDLWRSARPGEDPRFDEDRFLVWLSVMNEGGERFVAQRLAELPIDLVTLAFHKQLIVLDVDALFEEMGETDPDEVDLVEKALSNCLSEELDRYQVVARRNEGWDDVLFALLALGSEHPDVQERVLERCARMSARDVETEGGLYEVLTQEAMLEEDVAGEREDRRAEAGHVVPSSAAAFLKLARSGDASRDRDPLTRAYFRGLAPPAPPPVSASSATERHSDLAERLAAMGVLQPEVVAEREIPRLGPGGAAPAEPLLVRALRALALESPGTFTQRSEELAYLANVLVAGCSLEGRQMRPIEGVRAATAAVSLGLELRGGDPGAVLAKEPLDLLFRAAWAHLSREVSTPAAARLDARGATRVRDDARRAVLTALAAECPMLPDGRFLASLADVAAARTHLA